MFPRPCAGPCVCSDRPVADGDRFETLHLLSTQRLGTEPTGVLVAAHEAAHAVIGAHFGREIVSIEPRVDDRCGEAYGACCRYGRSPPEVYRTEAPAVLGLLAGHVAENYACGRLIYRPFDDELTPFVERVRGGRAGLCDICKAFGMLWLFDTRRTDAELIARFRQLLDQTIELMEQRPIRVAIARLARAFRAAGFLNAADIRAVLDQVDRDFGDALIPGSRRQTSEGERGPSDNGKTLSPPPIRQREGVKGVTAAAFSAREGEP